METFSPLVEWVPVCPEVEIGLAAPREPIQLVRSGDVIQLRTVATDVDLTERMKRYARTRVTAIAKEDLCGYVFKARSPSCGVKGVRVLDQRRGAGRRDAISRTGHGLFADELIRRYPNLPVAEETALWDLQHRSNFIERVFAYRAIRTLFTSGWTPRDLAAFHASHRPALLSHSASAYRLLDRLVREAATMPRRELAHRYEAEFMQTLARLPRRRSSPSPSPP